ncbi:MAG: DMT family transporter [Candidatus Kryptoniota bacterium]
MIDSRIKGYLYIFAAAVFWGSSGTAAKFLFSHSYSTLLVVESRVIIAAITLFSLLLIYDRNLLVVRVRDLSDFAFLGVFGIAGSNYTYYAAMQVTGVGIAILMQYTAPVLVAAYAVLAKHEKITPVKILAIGLSLSGTAILLGAFGSSVKLSSTGIVLGILSSFFFAFFNVYNRVAAKDYSTWTALAYTLLFASLFWILFDFTFPSVYAAIRVMHIPALLIFSMTSVLIPYFFYFSGLKYLVPSTAVIVSTLEPVVAIVTAFFVLGEGMKVTQLAGGALVILSVVILEMFQQ